MSEVAGSHAVRAERERTRVRACAARPRGLLRRRALRSAWLLSIALSGGAQASAASQPAPAATLSADVAAAWCHSGVAPADPDSLRAARACRDWLLYIARLDPQAMDIGYLWVLHKLEEQRPNPEIAAFVASWQPKFREGRGAIVYPDAPRRWLPKDPGEGLTRFHNWVSAPSGRPARRAISFIDAFTSQEAEGYVLTHQLFVLEWAKDTRLALPDEVSARAGRLLDRILAEHRADARPGDVDFERTLILMMYAAQVEEREARSWIERMLATWDTDAQRWTFPGLETIRFDGRRYELRHGPHHPTAMALGGVKTYLDRFALRSTGEPRP